MYTDLYYLIDKVVVPSKLIVALILVCTFNSVEVQSQDYYKYVDPVIGTEGRDRNGSLACGYTYVGATWPFGMVQFTPSFFSPSRGFVINQLSGAGCAHLGNFPVLPLANGLDKSPGNMQDFPLYRRVDIAHAGYLNVEMVDDTRAEFTVNERAGFARFTFPADSKDATVIIGSGVNSTFVNDAEVRITSKSTCEGFSEGGEFCGTKTPYRIYFAVEFDRPATGTGVWCKRKMKRKGKKSKKENSGAIFRFDVNNNQEVNYRIAISYVSIENAKLNLKAGLIDFDAVRTKNSEKWEYTLTKIKVVSDSEDELTQFYTNFYHALIHPNIVSDVNGDYMGGDFKVHNDTERPHYSSFSVWDTYRTQGPLLAILFPKLSSDMMQSVVDFAEQSGGFGRWVLANIETGIMQGDPTSILVASSYAFGATDFDVETAFKHMKQGATVPGTRSQNQEVRPHLEEYMQHGSTFASMMLEYTSADFAIGQFALNAMKDTTEASYFFKRSKNWKNIYNPEIKWLNSRYPSGDWKDIHHDWREGTYVNYFWMVPYDLETLVDTIGGKDFAESRLDHLFRRLDAGYDDEWFMAGNEPDFQAPWSYYWTNNGYKVQHTVFRILDEMYDSSPSGLPGNDDLGAMGAWYVFASIGFYPMIPGSSSLKFHRPQFREIHIRTDNGTLKIESDHVKEDMLYIEALKWNDKIYDSNSIEYDILKRGGILQFSTSAEPNKNWGVDSSPNDQK